MNEPTQQTIAFQNSNWQLVITYQDGVAIGFKAQGPDGVPYWAELVFYQEEGVQKSTLLFFEKPDKDGQPKCGDVNLILSKHKRTGRWMVRTEKERVFRDAVHSDMIDRATRSSVINPKQALKRIARFVGRAYLNARRIGGFPVFFHYILSGWSPEYASVMLDIAEYVETMDGPGHIALVKALSKMPLDTAIEIITQMHHPESADDLNEDLVSFVSSLDEEVQLLLLTQVAKKLGLQLIPQEA